MTLNYTFTEYNISHQFNSAAATSFSASNSNTSLNTDADKSYEVTANIFSESVDLYNVSVNTASTVGPLNFDCYTINTDASDANFTNSLTFSQSEGQSLPSWLTFDASTTNVSVSNPSTGGSDNYNITNSYTGVLGNFTLDRILTISVIDDSTNNNTNNNNTNNNTNTNDDEDHCLNASSEALCGVLVAVIAVVALLSIIAIAIIIYCKFKRRPQLDRSRVDREEHNDSHCQSEANRPTTNRQIQAQDAENLDFNENEHQSIHAKESQH